jgi:hypothetical protein
MAVIVYQADKRQFVHDTFSDCIESVLAQQFLRTTGRQVSPSEFRAWKNSLFEVGEVLKDPGMPDDMGVALEYTVPPTHDGALMAEWLMVLESAWPQD